ncbi:MAG TPA: L-lactate permease [Steroidobacteraceae bacterium]|jgi:lactate permease|nr:L-lactate permease [Steroidobacteraceae bacterium]
MFHQLLTPIADSLGASFCVAVLPIVALVVLLGVLRRPAWQAALAALIIAFLIAVGPWHMPLEPAIQSMLNGATFALWPVMWLVFNGLLLYNIAVRSGRFEAFRQWMTTNLPDDRRIMLVVIGFCFGALLEGIAGFGAPVAITSSLLIMTGFPAMEALVFVLIFNTAPVAFGALGIPVTVLGSVTGLPATTVAAMVGRQLPFMALILPFYVTALYGGWRSVRSLWPVLLVAGATFAAAQFLASNFLDYTLADVLSSLLSLAATLLFVRVWRPSEDPAYRINTPRPDILQVPAIPAWQGWLPWLIMTAVVIAWSFFGIAAKGQQAIAWPGLHNVIAITLYHDKPYAAIWSFQPLATGTAILITALFVGLLFRICVGDFAYCLMQTCRQLWLAVLTVVLIVAVAYLMNYSGLAYTLGKAAASTRYLFILLSPFLGWIAVALSGSDTSGNALFGNLQVVAARQLNLNPVLFAATNSSGGVMGKMISPQNIATGAAVTQLKGQEGVVFARTFIHSIVFTLMLVVLVVLQQFVFPGVIPAAAVP